MAALVLVFAVLVGLGVVALGRWHQDRQGALIGQEPRLTPAVGTEPAVATADAGADGDREADTSDSAAAWGSVDGLGPDGPDPAGPPASIRMAVSGAPPWEPAALFLTELDDEGYETTVELPDLVVVRDDARRPVTLREPAGAVGELLVTSPPDSLPRTLELLVRSLLASEYTLDVTEGRDVRLTDDADVEVRLTVSELARA